MTKPGGIRRTCSIAKLLCNDAESEAFVPAEPLCCVRGVTNMAAVPVVQCVINLPFTKRGKNGLQVKIEKLLQECTTLIGKKVTIYENIFRN
jgi:hypothetical protein